MGHRLDREKFSGDSKMGRSIFLVLSVGDIGDYTREGFVNF